MSGNWLIQPWSVPKFILRLLLFGYITNLSLHNFPEGTVIFLGSLKVYMYFKEIAIFDLKKKVSASRNLYISHIEDMENVVCLHKASANGCLEDISAKDVSNARFVEELLVKKLQKDNLYLMSYKALYQLNKEKLLFLPESFKRSNQGLMHISLYLMSQV